MSDAEGLRQEYERWAAEALARWLPRDSPQFPSTHAWVLGRFREGQEMARLLRTELPGHEARVLDLGSGNGGVSLGLCASGGFRVTASDCYLNGEVVELRERMPVSFTHAVGRGESLPFRDGAFDAVLLLDVIEHVADPRGIGREVARVLRDGGLLVITTPPRARFFLSGDPHHGIRGLALLPAFAQRLVAERLLRRTSRYDVRHLYLSARGVARELPPSFRVATHGGRGLLRRLGLDWDRIVAVKHPRV